MIVTNTTRLQIRNLMRTVCASKNITDRDKLEYVVDCVVKELEIQEAKPFLIDSDTIIGCVTPVADLYSRKCDHVERNGKMYLDCSEDSICIFAAENYAVLATERAQVLRPNGWGNYEDVIYGTVTYAKSTCRDMDGIFDLRHC